MSAQPPLVISGLPLLNPYVGLGTYTLRLIRGLAKNGRVPFQVLVPQTAESALALLPPGIAVIVPGGVPKQTPSLIQLLYWMDRVASFATGNHPNAIFHSPGSFWSRLHPAHTVVTLHDCIYREFPFYLGRYPFRRWLAGATERYAAHAEAVLTVSEFSARELHERAGIPAGKIRAIHQGIEDRFSPENARQEAGAVRAKYNLPARFLLYLGGYDYRKNVEFLIAAYALAKKQGPLPPLVLAGSVPTRVDRTLCDVHGALRRAGLAVGADVFLPGLIADADMPGLYGAAEMLVYPSRYEGFGLPPAEAMAAGTPVLVADNTSLREVVPAPRNRFSLDQPETLARLLAEACADPGKFLVPLDPRHEEAAAIEEYLQVLAGIFPGIPLTPAAR